MKYDFTILYENNENYILQMDDGDYMLVNRITGQTEQNQFAEKFLRFGLYNEVTQPVPDEVMRNVNDLIHHSVQEFTISDEEMEQMLKDIFGKKK